MPVKDGVVLPCAEVNLPFYLLPTFPSSLDGVLVSASHHEGVVLITLIAQKYEALLFFGRGKVYGIGKSRSEIDLRVCLEVESSLFG